MTKLRVVDRPILKIRSPQEADELEFWLEEIADGICWMAAVPGKDGWCVATITNRGMKVKGKIHPDASGPFPLPLDPEGCIVLLD